MTKRWLCGLTLAAGLAAPAYAVVEADLERLVAAN